MACFLLCQKKEDKKMADATIMGVSTLGKDA
jgi:hypothetical protein